MSEVSSVAATPHCDIIIPIWNQVSLTRRCLDSIQEKTRIPYRLILIDNGSEEETRNYLESLTGSDAWRGVLIRNDENLGYIKGINQGLRVSTAPYVCLLNNDIVVTGAWLEKMVEFARSHPDAGLVSCLQNNDPGRPMPRDLEAFAQSQVQEPGSWMELDHCTGGCLVVKREVIRKIGFPDEAFGDGYWEDNDYSRRAQQSGFRCYRLLDTYVWHDVAASFAKTPARKEKEKENEALYHRRWGKPLRILYPVSERVDFRLARFHQIFQTAHALARQGCEVDLILGKNETDAAPGVLSYYGLWAHENLRIHVLPMLRGENGWLFRVSWDRVFLWACWVKIRELLGHRPYDAIFTRHLSPAAFLLGRKGDFRLPLIFEAHEIFFLTTDKKEKTERIRLEESRIYPRMDGIVSISRGLADKMKEVFGITAPLEVIPDGVSPGLFSTVPGERKKNKIVYVGQLYPWKGAGTLIEALKELPGGELHLAGGSEERIRELKESAGRLGVSERAIFHGQVTPEQVRAHLAEAAVAVLPLTRELIAASFTSPLKLFEYMAAGVPIVASDVPSIREVLSDGVNAVLVPADDPLALAGGIQKILNDPAMGDRLAKRAAEDVFGYTWEKRAEKLIRFLRSLRGGEC
jgi:GT2 family glycosyltransferase